MANLRDVAKVAGVSLASAARVLSEDPTFKVAPQTKENIYNAAKELNYIYKKKNSKKNPQWKVGFILALTSEKYSDPFFTSILSAAEEAAENSGIKPVIARNYNEIRNQDMLNELLELNLDGLILMEKLPEDIFNKLKDNIPSIIGIDPFLPGINSISFDAIEAAMLVMDYFFSTGCEKIAYIGGASQNEKFDTSLRMMAYRESLRRHEIEYKEEWVKDCNWDLELCGKYTEELLTSDNPPDAIFAGSDTLASVILGKIFALGLKCPEDISVIGFNNLPMSAHTIPPLTTVEVPTKQIGQLAIKRLHDILDGSDNQVMNISLPVKLVIRESTKEK